MSRLRARGTVEVISNVPYDHSSLTPEIANLPVQLQGRGVFLQINQDDVAFI